MLYRTLLIGLGGTGVDVLRKFKTYHVQTTSPDERQHIKLLGIDTIQQEGETDELLSTDEFLHLAKTKLNAQMVRKFQDLPFLRWVKDHGIPNFDVGEGAGQKRLAGYLAYQWDGSAVRQRLEQAIGELHSPELDDRFRNIPDGASTRVFIVSSVCGGTGTGMFIDVSYLVESLFAAKQLAVKRFAFLFLPSAFPKLVNNASVATGIKANGYAALEELNYYMQSHFKNQELPAPDRMLNISGRAFDLCFLVGGQTERGQLVGAVDELYRRTANFIFTSVQFSRISTMLVGVLAVNPHGNYAAVGSFTLPLPQSAFTEKYTVLMGREMLADLFAPTAETQPDIDTFLAGTRLSEAIHPEKSQLLADVQRRTEQEVFIHGRPASHEQADQWMREETQAAKMLAANVREALAIEARHLVSDLSRVLPLVDSGTIVSGVLAAKIQQLKDLADRLSAVSTKLVSRPAAAMDEALTAALKRPGMFSKTQPESRMTEFRGALSSALEDLVLDGFSSELKQQIERFRSEVLSRMAALSSLLGEQDSVRDRFESKANNFLKVRRKNDTAGALAETEFGRNLVPDDRYQESRMALLNICRAEIKLAEILRPPASLDLDTLLQQLYRIATLWVKEKVTLSQALDSEAFEKGLNQAWTSLQLEVSPGGTINTHNIVFAPGDPGLQEQIMSRIKKWEGAAGSTPELESLSDGSAVMLIRLRTGFDLGNLLEVDDLKLAYEKALKDEQKAPFLKLPPHSRKLLRYDNAAQIKAEIFALSLAIGILEEFGQNLKFNGGNLLLDDERDPIARRRKAYDLLLDPDREQMVSESRDRKLKELGQRGFGQMLKKQYLEIYGEIQGPTELKTLLQSERHALADYCASIGTYID